jgi:hypothetical protein
MCGGSLDVLLFSACSFHSATLDSVSLLFFLLREPFMPAFGLLKIYCISHSRHVCAEFFLRGENTFSFSYFSGFVCASAGRQECSFSQSAIAEETRRRGEKAFAVETTIPSGIFVCHIKNW